MIIGINKEVIDMFLTDFWKHIRKFINGNNNQRTSEYWDRLVIETNALYKKHCPFMDEEFSRTVLIAFISEMERRNKVEVALAKQRGIKDCEAAVIPENIGRGTYVFHLIGDLHALLVQMLTAPCEDTFKALYNKYSGHTNSKFANELLASAKDMYDRRQSQPHFKAAM